MSSPVQLSRRFLSDTGGWKEMKAARGLHSAGRVDEADYRDGRLQGLVREAGKTFKVRLEIRSRTDVENHCPCRRARRDGIICAHALAVGLEWLEPTATGAETNEPGTSSGDQPLPSPAAGHRTGTKPPAPSPAWPTLTEQADDQALPAALHLVLPSDLAGAWKKGRLTLGIEIEVAGERRLLKAQDTSQPLFLDPLDAALYRALQALTPESVPGMLSVSPDGLADLFATVPGHERVTLGKKASLHLSSVPFRPQLVREKGLRFRVDWPADLAPLLSPRGAWVRTHEDLLQPVAPGLEETLQPVLAGGLTLDPASFPAALRVFRTHFQTDALEIARSTPDVRLELEGSLRHLEAELAFAYGDEVVPASEDRPAVREDGDVLHLADAETECAAVAELEEAGFRRRGSGGRFVLKDKAAIVHFLAHGYPAFRSRWRTSTGERFEHALGQVEPVETNLDFRTGGEDWFAVEVDYATPSGESIPRAEIENLLRTGQNQRPVSGGKIAVLDTRAAGQLGEILTDCDPEQVRPGTYRIGREQADYLGETAEDGAFRARGAVPWKTAEEAIDFYPLSDDLEQCLRPYQRRGVEWMQRLASRGLGGILADDMGLGKTLQTLAFIYSLGGRALVVCPASVVPNWIDEAAAFVPELKAVAVEGPDREAILAGGDADIFVTSYALLRRDEALYRELEFDVAVLDEAQHIKNPDAQVSKAAHALCAAHRFALTGTPVENSVRDLWSIARFALPGYLGERRDFAERFEKPLASSDPPASVRERLSRRLRPVVLRRLKREVATDLPERIEQVVHCDLKPAQRDVYDRLLRQSRESIQQAEGGRKRMMALTALLRLRQACCDLRLLDLPSVDDEDASVKAEVLSERLDEAVEGGHRVLVFSQFVEMLQLLVPVLAEKGVDFCYLDGATRDRAGPVKRFQEGGAPVFLISLKAGGVGLNLTAADTVIHADPWWNPAVEAQATDRAHRIGQRRVVTSYKLITRHTVEEKILALQARKREMTDSLLSEAGDAALSESELMGLLE